ncbi:MAG: hypothetical protein JXC32_12960, partial [Anaerolineae bacterium]|nr:hypothetical protein [Anaerolineae bacterium]
MERSSVQTFNRWEILDGARLVLWLVALVSYFAPWIAREPVSAALAWNAYDLFDLLRFLPEIETGAVSVNLQALRLPLVGLAVLLPILLAGFRTWVRVAGALLSSVLSLLTLPPYPQILTAWRTPGWRVPFWWGVGALACVWAGVWLAPRSADAGDRRAGKRHARQWCILGIAEIATVPAIVTLRRLLPPLRTLHAAWVRPGWGFWGCVVGLGAIGALAWAQVSFADTASHSRRRGLVGCRGDRTPAEGS